MIKRLLTLVLMVLALIGWAVPQEWSVDISRVQPHQFNAYHGETLEMKASFFLRGQPYDVAGDDFSLFWQTNGMGTVYWAAPAVAASNTVSAVFTGAMDPGAPLVYGFLGSTGSNYRASFAVRFAASPGAAPNELPLPVETIDFAKVAVLNAPWATKSEIDEDLAVAASAATNYTDAVASSLREGLAVAASAATNYTDSVAASLGALAWVDSVDWADILGKPSWIGDTKPTYSLNDVCPDTENWLGVQGNAGRHIKVLAGTAGGQIVGGLRVTASTQNDNNMTTYTYGGVAVRRNGVNTDYLFDTSSQSGIVRRSELASLAPATNIARSALAQDVQASLDKADSALQTAPVSSVNGKTGAVSLTASDVGALPTTGGEMTGQLRINQNLNILPPVPIRETGLLVRFVLPYGDIVSAVYGARDITLFNGDNAPVAVLSLPTTSGTLALTSDIPSVAGLAPLASPAFTGTPTAPTPAASDDSTKVATTEFVQEAISGISSWSATNTVAVIARHTGKETVSIPSGGNLVADLSGWNDGVQTFVVLQPSGAYTVASNVEYCGYGTWPTNTALCVAWPYAGTLYVNPITIIRE